jgi:hypothetical protein
LLRSKHALDEYFQKSEKFKKNEGKALSTQEWEQVAEAESVLHIENGLVLYSVTSEVTSGLGLYPGSYELRVTGTSGFRCENIELW